MKRDKKQRHVLFQCTLIDFKYQHLVLYPSCVIQVKGKHSVSFCMVYAGAKYLPYIDLGEEQW